MVMNHIDGGGHPFWYRRSLKKVTPISKAKSAKSQNAKSQMDISQSVKKSKSEKVKGIKSNGQKA